MWIDELRAVITFNRLEVIDAIADQCDWKTGWYRSPHVILFNTRLPPYEFVIYSAHKTGTESMLRSLQRRGKTCTKLHNACNAGFSNPLSLFGALRCQRSRADGAAPPITKILCAIRDPVDRLRSSFFQTFHQDEIIYRSASPDKTTIVRNDTAALHALWCFLVMSDRLPGGVDSIDEIAQVVSQNRFLWNEQYGCLVTPELHGNQIYLFSFEDLIHSNVFLRITGCPLLVQNTTASRESVVAAKYRAFVALPVPDHVRNHIAKRYHHIDRLLASLREKSNSTRQRCPHST